MPDIDDIISIASATSSLTDIVNSLSDRVAAAEHRIETLTKSVDGSSRFLIERGDKHESRLDTLDALRTNDATDDALERAARICDKEHQMAASSVTLCTDPLMIENAKGRERMARCLAAMIRSAKSGAKMP